MAANDSQRQSRMAVSPVAGRAGVDVVVDVAVVEPGPGAVRDLSWDVGMCHY
jgi:hypothetical protein